MTTVVQMLTGCARKGARGFVVGGAVAQKSLCCLYRTALQAASPVQLL